MASNAANAYFSLRYQNFKSTRAPAVARVSLTAARAGHHSTAYKFNAADPWEHQRLLALGDKPTPSRRGMRRARSLVSTLTASLLQTTCAAFIDEHRKSTGGTHKDAAAAWDALSDEEKKSRQRERDHMLEECALRTSHGHD